MNKRKRKKQLKNNREELRQNLLKLEEVKRYFETKGVYAFSQVLDEEWELAFDTDKLIAFSKKVGVPKNFFTNFSDKYYKTGIQLDGFQLYSLDDKENKNDI